MTTPLTQLNGIFHKFFFNLPLRSRLEVLVGVVDGVG